MKTRRNIIVGSLTLVGGGVAGGLYLNERRDISRPVVPESGYAPGNVIIENWDDINHKLSIYIAPNPENQNTATNTSKTANDPVLNTELTVEKQGTKLLTDVIEGPGIYRMTVQSATGGHANYDTIRLWRDTDGKVTGFAVRLRIYDDGSMNIVGYADDSPPLR